MWIARDKNGMINGFMFKPVRSTNSINPFNKEPNVWTNPTFGIIWSMVPIEYLEYLKIPIPSWENEPIEVDLAIVQTQK